MSSNCERYDLHFVVWKGSFCSRFGLFTLFIALKCVKSQNQLPLHSKMWNYLEPGFFFNFDILVLAKYPKKTRQLTDSWWHWFTWAILLFVVKSVRSNVQSDPVYQVYLSVGLSSWPKSKTQDFGKSSPESNYPYRMLLELVPAPRMIPSLIC